MARVDDEGRDDRREPACEVAGERRAVRLGVGVRRDAHEPLALELALHERERLLVAVYELGKDLEDVVELLGGRVVRLVVAGLVLEGREVRETANANHEPLVEVALEYRAELESLEQRDGLVEGLVEDAVVKAEPADLAVLGVGEIALLVGVIGRRRLGRIPLCRLLVLRGLLVVGLLGFELTLGRILDGVYRLGGLVLIAHGAP